MPGLLHTSKNQPSYPAFCESFGKDQPVLFIHGNSSSGLSFKHQMESDLANRYRFVAIDLPGHGLSGPMPEPETSYTLSAFTDQLIAFVEKEKLEEAIFVGWSLGGYLLLEAAERLPHAAGFMIFGTPPFGCPEDLAQAYLPHPAGGLFLKTHLSVDEVEAMATACLRSRKEEIPPFFRDDIVKTDPMVRQVVAESLANGDFYDSIRKAESIKKPLAILHGQNDPFINLNYLENLTISNLWRGKVQLIPGAGHAPQWEKAEHFNRLLELFIKESNIQR